MYFCPSQDKACVLCLVLYFIGILTFRNYYLKLTKIEIPISLPLNNELVEIERYLTYSTKNCPSLQWAYLVN